MCIQHVHTLSHAQKHSQKKVSKPLKAAAPGTKFMVRTQQRANKQGRAGCFMNTNFISISQKATTWDSWKLLDSRTTWTGWKLLFEHRDKLLSTFVWNHLLLTPIVVYCRQYCIVRLLCEIVTSLAKNCCCEWKVGKMEAIGRGNNSLNQWSQEPDISGTRTNLPCQALTSLTCVCVCVSVCVRHKNGKRSSVKKTYHGLPINNLVLVFLEIFVIPCPWGCNDLGLIHT